MNGFNVWTASKADARGEAMLTTEGMSYQRSLVAGDTITLSVQGKGVDFDQARAKFSLTGPDAAPDMHRLRTGAGATNNWGLSQTVVVVNASSAAIRNWSVKLDLLRRLDLDITRLWARDGQARADSDLLFMALASMHQLMPEVRFQCYS
jgi:hypothetical protein